MGSLKRRFGTVLGLGLLATALGCGGAKASVDLSKAVLPGREAGACVELSELDAREGALVRGVEQQRIQSGERLPWMRLCELQAERR